MRRAIRWFIAAVPCVIGCSLLGQGKQVDRVVIQPELTTKVRLAGHIPRWAAQAADLGKVADETPLRLTFVLSRSPEQQAAFEKLLADQQDAASPRFHQWLTPQQVGELYGPTSHDLDVLTTWLQAHDLGGIEISPSRMFLTANGSAGAVSSALSTSFHSFALADGPRIATVQEPALPASLAGIVSAIQGLTESTDRPTGRGIPGTGPGQAQSVSTQPQYSFGSSNYIAPGDFATIFDLAATNGKGFTGVGQRVAVIGRSRVATTDITQFENFAHLPANLPTVVIPGAGPDPGLATGGDQLEATLDVGRVLGTAPDAQVDLVILPSSVGGIYSAAQYEVNTLNDPIMTISFGSCEANQGSSGAKMWDTLFSQAAAQGISVFVSSSDSGAATCDQPFVAAPVNQIRSINYICASSYATCVGGTEFNDFTNSSQYWQTVALGYIPEGAWNEPSQQTSGGGFSYVVQSGGGGASTYISKPAWQSGSGVPADGARDVPDISFPAAAHDGYYACYASGNGDCGSGRFIYFYGTSAGAPSMAAITAIVNQRTGTRQGNVNPLLYSLAGNPTNGVFHDTTVASSGVAGCSISIPSMCNNSTPSPAGLQGGLDGYLLTPGYDQATGWGSIDVGKLLVAVGTTQVATTTSLTQSAVSILIGDNVTFTVKVTSNSPGTPTGSVQLTFNGVAMGPALVIPPGGGTLTVTYPFTTVASYYVQALYSGDAGFAPSTSFSSSLSVNKPPTVTTITPASATITTRDTLSYTIKVTGALGTPTGTVQLFNGNGSSNNQTLTLINGQATTAPVAFPAGRNDPSAIYSGDATYAGSSTIASLTVNGIPTVTTMTASTTTATPQQSVVFTSAVTGSGGTPTGSIQLLLDGSTWGAPVPMTGLTVVFPATTIPLGIHTVSSRYVGDAIFAPSTSNNFSYTVSGFSISSSPNTLTLFAGATSLNSVTLTYTSISGFSGTVNQGCTVTYNGTGVPNYLPTCSFSAPSVVLSTGGTASSTLAVGSTTPHAVTGSGTHASLYGHREAYSAAGLSLVAIALLPFHRRRLNQNWRGLLVASLVLGGLFSLGACSSGNGGGSGSSSPVSNPVLVGTTAGSYTISITSSSNGTQASPNALITLNIK